jgi:hypothetical protein
MLSIVAEMQAGRELERSKSGPSRTGQTDHMFGIRDGSIGNGYQKRGRKPGRRADFMNDPKSSLKGRGLWRAWRPQNDVSQPQS